MPFKIKRRGKLTYYYEADDPVLSNLVVETLPDGDMRICFSGLTGGYSAAGILGLDEVPHMDPDVEIPLVFQCWELWLQEAGICDSIADVDFIEVHAFATQPKSARTWTRPATKPSWRGCAALMPAPTATISGRIVRRTVCPPASPCTWLMCPIKRPATNFMRWRCISGACKTKPCPSTS